MYFRRPRQLGKILAGGMVETPFSAPGYYLSELTFAEGRGPTLAELMDLGEKLSVHARQKYGDDVIELGQLEGKFKDEPGRGTRTIAPHNIKEYVKGTLKFRKGDHPLPYPQDLANATESTRFNRAYLISWVKVPCNFDASFSVPTSFTVKEDGTVTSSEDKIFVLKNLGYTAKPSGSIRGAFEYFTWYDPQGKPAFTSAVTQDGKVYLWGYGTETPAESGLTIKLEGLGFFQAITIGGVVKVVLAIALVAAIAALVYVLVSCKNSYITDVGPDGKERKLSAPAFIVKKFAEGLKEMLVTIGWGVGVAAVAGTSIWAISKWGVPAYRRYKERKALAAPIATE
jgi:hypothetical protein